jgi:glyoxylase-like metal-dependent hydrolase (beta-lactamase superfamily II)
MTYTGNVSAGGPADTRELPGLTITKVSVGPMDNNAYLLRCTETGELALIDAANDADTLLGLVADVPLATIITTHQHWDHHAALQHGDTIAVGNARLSVIHLRGHTPGSIALVYDGDGELADQPHLFTGDSLFPGGPGNTEHDASRFSSLITDLEDRVFAELPDGTWVYPGHGKDTTLGAERPHVPEWRARGW